MERGEIWWAELPAPKASEPGYRHPVLVVQSDSFNRSRIRSVVVAVITTNLELAEAAGNIRLDKRVSKLPRASVVNVSQLLTIDRDQLTERVSRLSPATVEAIDAGLRIVLGL